MEIVNAISCVVGRGIPLPDDAFHFTPPPGATAETGGRGGFISSGGGRGSSQRRGDGQVVEHRGSSEWQGDTLVERSRWKMRRMTLDFERRLTFTPDGKELRVQERIAGPKGDTEASLTLPVA